MNAAEFLAESKRIEEAATPGPWATWRDRFNHHSGVVTDDGEVTVSDDVEGADAAFIAHARTALHKMREALEAVLAIHQPLLDGTPHAWCTNCAESFPCRTVRAIESALAENGGEN